MPTYWSGSTVVGSSRGEASGKTTAEYANAATANYKSTGSAFNTGAILGLTDKNQLYVAGYPTTSVPTDAAKIAANPAVVNDPLELHNPASDYPYQSNGGGNPLSSGGKAADSYGISDTLTKIGTIPLILIGIVIIAILFLFGRK